MKVRIQKITSVFLAVVLSLFAFVIPALAANMSIPTRYYYKGQIYYSQPGYPLITGESSLIYESSYYVPPSTTDEEYYLTKLVDEDDPPGYYAPTLPNVYLYDYTNSVTGDEYVVTDGAVAVYFAFRYKSFGTLTLYHDFNILDESWVDLMYCDQSNVWHTVNMDISLDDTFLSENVTSTLLLSASVDIPSNYECGHFRIQPYVNSVREFPEFECLNVDGGGREGTDDGSLFIEIISCQLIYTESNEVLLQLQEIADKLVSTNTTLKAMYGDIVSLLNNIYTRLGSIQSVESVANSYLSSIFSKVSNVESALSSLSNVSWSSYDLLSTYLHYLQDIALTADDIETELSSISSKLDLVKTYLSDFVLNYVPAWNDMFSSIDGSTTVISSMVSEYLSYLLNIACNSDDVNTEMKEFHADYVTYSNALVAWLIDNNNITEYLQRIQELLEQFTSNYSGGNVTYEMPDGYIVTNPDGTESEKFSFFDLAKAIIKGIWTFVTGVVTTFIGGLTGLISAISNISGFFDFYRDGEIYGLTDYQGGDIWD